MRADYRDLSLVQPGAPAHGALARPGKAIGSEDEPALLASCRLDHDAMARGLGRSNRMAEIVFHVAPVEPQFARERRHRARLDGQSFDEIAAEGHLAIIQRRTQGMIARRE
jgi:hypothetical protein